MFGARAEWHRREMSVRMFVEPGESLMRPELHGIMRLRADDGWRDGAMAATSRGVKDGRMTGRLLWLATTGAGESLRTTQQVLSLPYDDIVGFALRPGGWNPWTREIRVSDRDGDRQLRLQGARTFTTKLAQLLPFVVHRPQP